MNPELAARFAEMRTCSTDMDILLWVKLNDDAFYANGRRFVDAPETPSWRFTGVAFERMRFVENEDTGPYGRMTLRFEIEGNDPYWTIRHMFTDTGLELLSMTEGWHDFQANLRLTPDLWAPLFVRRKLEHLE